MARKRANRSDHGSTARGGEPDSGAASARGTAGPSPRGPDLPPWVPPTVFAVLTAFLFREFIFSDLMLVGSDTLLAGGYAVRALYAESLQALGHIPGWEPHILGGTPFLEALSAGDALYPPSLLLLLITEPHRALGWKLVLHVFLAGLFFYGWIRTIGGSKAAALLGGTAYMAAPFLVSFVAAGHDGKMFVTALAPLMFWMTERHFARPGPATFAGIGLVVAMIIYTTHFQMAYFLFGATGLYAIFRAVQIARDTGTSVPNGSESGTAAETDARPRRRRAGATRFALFLGAAIIGATGAGWQFFPAADYVTEYSRRIQTTREAAGQSGRTWSSSFSMNAEEAMSLVVPEFAGNGAGGADWSNGTYWGRNGLKNNHEYAGLVVLLLAAVSFLGAARKQLRYFLTGLGLLALLFALGANTPVWGFFYQFVPGIRLFRAPGMVVYLFGFSAITLAALGLDRILRLGRENDEQGSTRVTKTLWIGTGVVGVIAALATTGILTSIWTSVLYRSIDERRLQVLQAHLPNIVQGASVAVLFAAATAGLVWAFATGRLSARLLVAGLVLLVAADELRIDAPFIQTIDFYEWSAPDPNIRRIVEMEQGSTEPYRLLSLARAGQDISPVMQGIELAAGHHPNDLSRYRELIGMVGSGMPENLLHGNVRRILNVRYLLWPDIELGPAPEGNVVSRTQYGEGRVYHTLFAEEGLPRARLLANAVVKSDDEAVPYILSEAHDPAVEVVLADESPIALDGQPVTGSVTWIERTADRMQLAVESDRPALLVIGDNWFPAWQATVDGNEAEVLRAYHSVRAVPVPAGSSTVEMWYHSDMVASSRLVSILVLLGLAGLAAFGFWRDRRETRP